MYISGEESLKQIKLRANRIGAVTGQLLFLCETSLEIIQETIRETKPDVVIIDSIQTMFREEIASAPGSVSQVRESTNLLMQIAKGEGITIFIVGHVTKEGVVAGPTVFSEGAHFRHEHIVHRFRLFFLDEHHRQLKDIAQHDGWSDTAGLNGYNLIEIHPGKTAFELLGDFVHQIRVKLMVQKAVHL